MTDARVHEHEAAEFLWMQIGCLHRHVTAKAVGYDDGVVAQARVFNDRQDLLGISLARILIAVIRVSHAREIHGRNLVLVRELGGDKVPPARVGIHAVYQKHAGLTGRGIKTVRHIAFVHFNSTTLCGCINGFPEPVWNGRCIFFIPACHQPSF